MSKTFADFPLHESLQLALQGLGFTAPTPVQEQSIPAALEGKDLLVSSQTGSGKTYTMMGKPGNPEQKGLIPRSLEQIFQTRQSLQSQGWKYEMQVKSNLICC